jgi:hypothetical protein
LLGARTRIGAEDADEVELEGEGEQMQRHKLRIGVDQQERRARHRAVEEVVEAGVKSEVGDLVEDAGPDITKRTSRGIRIWYLWRIAWKRLPQRPQSSANAPSRSAV